MEDRDKLATENVEFAFPEIKDQTQNIIKVIGVGGGGGNATGNMYQSGVHNVSFAVCNTDSQALMQCPVPVKIQLGPGLGAGGNPSIGRQYAEEDIDNIRHLFDDNTQMVFITAGMGGGTGTGAGPIIAREARNRGILTIGVVTTPFRFEQKSKINKALAGVVEMQKSVDALLVINNERLRDIYPDLDLEQAFQKVDEILTVATRCIAEIITRKGIINRDFCDVKFVMENGGSAIMAEGRASGEHRVERAMLEALNSPLMSNSEIRRAKRLLCIFYQSEEKPLGIKELDYVTSFMDELQSQVEVIWGLYKDDSLGQDVKVSIVATGFNENDSLQENEEKDPYAELRERYYGKPASPKPELVSIPLEEETTEEPNEEPEPDGGEEPTEGEEPEAGTSPVLGRLWESFVHKARKILEEE